MRGRGTGERVGEGEEKRDIRRGEERRRRGRKSECKEGKRGMKRRGSGTDFRKGEGEEERQKVK